MLAQPSLHAMNSGVQPNSAEALFTSISALASSTSTIGSKCVAHASVSGVSPPLTSSLPLPVMRINPDVTDIAGFEYEDFTLEGYEAHPHIKAPIAV